MELHNDESVGYQPLLLVRSTSFPTYQLHAFAGNGKIPPEDVLKIVILETMKWLRQRFRAFELPVELDLPEPSRYAELSSEQLVSFYLNMGYKLEVIWLPEETLWTLQLTEPDLGANPGSHQQAREPVPGRLFETNVSYRICAEGVECGFKTIVSEPLGTETFCEVFRLAFIKHLARNPFVGLRETWPLRDEAHRLIGLKEIKRLKSWLLDSARMLPAVIIAEFIPTSEPTPILSDWKDIPLPWKESLQTRYSPNIDIHSNPLLPQLPLNIKDMSRFRMGYAQFFVLPVEQRDAFIKCSGQNLKDGEILVVEAKAFMSTITKYPFCITNSNPGAVYDKLDFFIQNYPKGKTYTFGDSVFVPEAQEIEREKIIQLHKTKEDVAAAFNEKLRATEEKHQKELSESRSQLSAKEEKIARLSKKIEEIEAEKKTLRVNCENTQVLCNEMLFNKDCEIDRYKACLVRPHKPISVEAWCHNSFCGKLILHDRAKAIMQKIPASQVNMKLLCDALEYLATEYRDELLGLIDITERDRRCSQKYERPFEVVPTKGASIKMYPKDYKIKYYIGYKGNPVESELNLHLRVGNESDNLLRIYFLFDKNKKLIVIGSLPEHLKTTSYK